MATLSVLNYNLPAGLTMKINNQNSSQNSGNSGHMITKTFNKITVQNVLSENSGNSMNITNGSPNAIVRKIKDFGMIGAVNNASGAASLNINPRKRPLMENKQQLKPAENKPAAPANKKPKLTKEERAAIRAAKKSVKENSSSLPITNNKEPLALVQATKVPGTPGRKGLPLPQAVARRNARERNRVKQVNNGFALLRERIPEEVAEAFENQGNKASGKKLSKVETLRMAVEYIRSLERLLGFDFPIGGGHHHPNSSSGEESFSLIKDEFDAYSPSMDEQFDDSLSHYDTEEYFNGNSSNHTQIPASPSAHSAQQQHMDMLPNITTLNGLQYIRIPGTNTYQLLTPDIFVGTASSPPSSTIDEEHFNALIDTNCVSPASSSPILQGCTNSSGLADLHNTSPPPPPPSSSSINSLEVIRRVQETAPVLTTATQEENFNEGSLLSTTSLSPVPQSQQLQHQQQQLILPISSPSSSRCSSSSSIGSATKSPVLHQRQQQHHATLSPASTNDRPGLRQTCAANQQQLHQQRQEFVLPKTTVLHPQIGTIHMIKQEFEEPSIIYQQTSASPQHHQQQQQQQLFQTVHNLTMSPPLDRNTPTTSTSDPSTSSAILQNFYANEQNSSFYEGVVNLKKEFNEVLLDASHSTHGLSDESMIEAIDWWDAHTPKSDVGSGML